MIDTLLKAWPLILLIATGLGMLIAWLATKPMRKATAATGRSRMAIDESKPKANFMEAARARQAARVQPAAQSVN